MKMKFNFIFNIQPGPTGRYESCNTMRIRPNLVALIASVVCLGHVSAPTAMAQDSYNVTYSHHMEEPGNLEIAFRNVTAKPQGGENFFSSTMELEYGMKGWWTTEVYFSGQSTANQNTVYTGVRWENRFRPLKREHWLNPVLYIEFEDTNGADRALLAVVGKDGNNDLTDLVALARLERKREVETKLILS